MEEEIEPSEAEHNDREEALRDAEVMLAMAMPASHNDALAKEREHHYREIEKNYGDGVPTVEDFKLLNEIDKFATMVKGAVRYLADCGHGRDLIQWALRRHMDTLEDGTGNVLPLVHLVAHDAIERLGRHRGEDLHRALVAAGAASPSRRIGKVLDDAKDSAPAVAIDHYTEDSYDLERASASAEYYGEEEDAAHYDARIADAQARWIRDGESRTRLCGLGLWLNDEDEQVARDDVDGTIVRSVEWRRRARRRRIAVRRHFGRIKLRPR